MTPAQLIFLLLLFAAVALAFSQGGKDERRGAMALVTATVMTPFVQFSFYSEPEAGIILVDLLLFCGLAAISLKSASFWPMWAAGFQLCSLAVHIASVSSQKMLPAAYAETLAIWAFPVVISLGLGTWLECGRKHGRT